MLMMFKCSSFIYGVFDLHGEEEKYQRGGSILDIIDDYDAQRKPVVPFIYHHGFHSLLLLLINCACCCGAAVAQF